MNYIEILLLALALCVDSFIVSVTCSLHSKLSIRRGLLMAVVFAFFQGVFPFAGALLGMACHDLMASIDHWISFGLLLLVGGKMIVDAVRDVPEEKQLDVSSIGVMCLLGIATSIDAFVVGIGLGLETDMLNVIVTVVTIGIMTFVVSLSGLFLGKYSVTVPERLANILAGLVLVGLGVYTLVEQLVV